MIGNSIAGFLGTGVAVSASSYESIATATGTGSAGSITFTSIPSTYKHLQIRSMAKDTNTAGNTTLSVEMQLNGDTGANYAYHELRGDGTSATTNAGSADTKLIIYNSSLRETVATSSMGVSLIDIHDYASTTKNKTVRYMSGVNKNLGTTSDRVSLGSGLWINISAVTSITLIPTQTAFTTTTTFALYGIKGA
jgi:hypothetical protein